MENQKKLKIKESKFFWAFWALSAVLLTLGVFLLPVWESVGVFWKTWASSGISLILFILLVIYICYMICGAKKNLSKIQLVIRVVEIVILVVLAILCLLQHFGIFNIIGPCFVIGAIAWLRGVVCVLNVYLFDTDKNKSTLSVIIVGLLAVSLGVFFMARRFTTPIFIWIISIGLMLLAVCCTIMGVLSMPKKAKNNKETKTNKKGK